MMVWLRCTRMGASAKPVQKRQPAVGSPLPHDSARLHVTGRAAYTDDLPEPRDLLHVAVGMSSVAHADVGTVDLSAVLVAPDVVDVCIASDIPGVNNYGPIIKDDPIFASDLVQRSNIRNGKRFLILLWQ